MFYVYVITHRETTRHYVGVTNNYKIRWSSHRRAKDPKYFHYAIRKYGADAFTWQVVETFATSDDAAAGEEWWIAFLRANVSGYGFNLTTGGQHAIPGESTRAKMSAAHIGRTYPPASEATRAAVSRARLVQGPETSARMKTLWATQRDRIVSAMRGVKKSVIPIKSEETRRKSSEAQRGKLRCEAARLALRTANDRRIGLPLSEDARRKDADAMKAKWMDPAYREKRAAAVVHLRKGSYAKDGVKKCSRCLTLKNAAEFFRDKSTPDGLVRACKMCCRQKDSGADSCHQQSKSDLSLRESIK